MKIVNGYKMDGTDLKQVEMVVKKIQDYLKDKGDKYYKKLLSKEIQTLIDDISLGIVERPTTISIYDVAKNNLGKKIFFSTSRNIATHYNLNISITVYTYKDNTYFKINCLNTNIFKHINGIDEVAEFCVKDTDKESSNQYQVWKEIMEIYNGTFKPLVMQIYPCDENIDVSFEDLKFDSVDKRISQRARHNISNQLLSMLSMGEQIKDYQLMPLMDEVFETITDDNLKVEKKNIEMKLKTILISNITSDLIFKTLAETNAEINENNDADVDMENDININ